MAIQQRSYTSSQEASAAMHLDRAAEWSTVRIDGTRYVVLPSANSGRTYWVRADAAGCSCVYYERTGRTCSHMLAVERSAMLEELAEQPAPLAQSVPTHGARCLTDLDAQSALDAIMVQHRAEQAPAPATRYDALFPSCRICGDLADGRDGLCDRDAADAAYAARIEGKRLMGVR